MLSGDSENILLAIKARDWPGLEKLVMKSADPKSLIKSIMSKVPELFEEKALFARPENNYRCIQEQYFPAINLDDLISTIKQNRRKFI